MVAVGLGVPLVVDQFQLLQLTVFASMCILALSLGVVWGYGGILCFGQSAFFGLGAYTYAVTAVNLAESTLAILLSIVVPAVFAALLGYFMFYGRLSDVYLGVITLSVTLIFFNLMNSTAGDAYRIGIARLNGFNGMPSLPTFNVPGNPGRLLDPTETFYLVMALLLSVYVGLHALLASHFGRVVVAVRENETLASLARVTRLGSSAALEPGHSSSPAACSPTGAPSSVPTSSASARPRRSSSGSSWAASARSWDRSSAACSCSTWPPSWGPSSWPTPA